MRIATIAIVCSIKSAMLVSCALFAVFLSLLTTEPHAFAASCSFPLSQAIGESCDGLASSGNGNIDNSGVIGDINNIEVAVRNYGNISLFANTGSISSSIWGIVNSGTISNFVNNGIVRAGYEAFLNYGNTILLVNRGSFIGYQYYVLGNRGHIN